MVDIEKMIKQSEKEHTGIQKYFNFGTVDGRIMAHMMDWDKYEIFYWAHCIQSPVPEKDRDFHHYHGRAEFSGPFVYQLGNGNEGFEVAFKLKLKQTRDDLEEYIKKAEGTKNIWVLTDDGRKFLKQI